MLKLLADENIPKRLVRLLLEKNVDVKCIAELSERGISDAQVVVLANKTCRTILTRDSDFTALWLLSRAKYGVVYIAYMPRKEDLEHLANVLAKVATRLNPKPGLLVVIRKEGLIEIHQ